jgi:hypothetical protein
MGKNEAIRYFNVNRFVFNFPAIISTLQRLRRILPGMKWFP